MILQANSLNIPLKDESVQCVITSPPYWGLRDYGTATWEGGKNGCDHIGEKPRTVSGGDGKQYTNEGSNRVYSGDCKCGAKRIDNQLGLEKTPEEYVENCVKWAREVWRVLRKDGCFWLNLGDSYAGSWGAMSHDLDGKAKRSGSNEPPPQSFVKSKRVPRKSFRRDGAEVIPGRWGGGNLPATGHLKPKDLCGIPWKVVFALQADGWWLRSAMPWVKRSAMPESCTDRPASALEYMFLLTKSGTSQYWINPRLGGTRQQPKPDYIWKQKETGEQVDIDPNDENYKRINLWQGHDYYFDMDAIRKELSPLTKGFGLVERGKKDYFKDRDGTNQRKETLAKSHYGDPPNGRNFRNTDLFYQSLEEPHGAIFCGDEMVGLDVNPQAYSEAHFATFPEWLVTPLIKAGTSEKGACPECGAPWERVVEKGDIVDVTHTNKSPHGQTWGSKGNNKSALQGSSWMTRDKIVPGHAFENKTTGWQPTCSHKAEPVPCIVLDPFGGSGTTKNVADRLGRRGVICELKMEYIEMAKERCYQELSLF